MRKYLLLGLIFFTSCKQPLEVYIDSIEADDLASNHVDTPDPARLCPDIGQKLVITWNLSRNCPLGRHIVAKIRYGNREEVKWEFYLNTFRGSQIYELINEDYCEKRGITSYIVQLFENDECIETVQHMLWCDLIEVGCK